MVCAEGEQRFQNGTVLPILVRHENKDAYPLIRIPSYSNRSQTGTSLQDPIRVYTEL